MQMAFYGRAKRLLNSNVGKCDLKKCFYLVCSDLIPQMNEFLIIQFASD